MEASPPTRSSKASRPVQSILRQVAETNALLDDDVGDEKVATARGGATNAPPMAPARIVVRPCSSSLRRAKNRPQPANPCSPPPPPTTTTEVLDHHLEQDAGDHPHPTTTNSSIADGTTDPTRTSHSVRFHLVDEEVEDEGNNNGSKTQDAAAAATSVAGIMDGDILADAEGSNEAKEDDEEMIIANKKKKTNKPLKGILVRHKQQQPPNESAAEEETDAAAASVDSVDTLSAVDPREETSDDGPVSLRKKETRIIVQDRIVERPRRRRTTKSNDDNTPRGGVTAPPPPRETTTTRQTMTTTRHPPGCIEGYTPRTTSVRFQCDEDDEEEKVDDKPAAKAAATPAIIPPDKDDVAANRAMAANTSGSSTRGSGVAAAAAVNDEKTEDDDAPPIVFHSLSEMMAVAGTLPTAPSSSNASLLSDAVVVEAELQFSCMDPEEYDRQLQQEEDDDDDDDEEEDQYDPQQTHAIPDENSDPDDDGFFGMFGADDDEEEEEEEKSDVAPPPPRAFLKLWTAVAQWVTPEAVQYVVGGGIAASPVPAKSDIEMSRCIALMNLLRLHLNNNHNSNNNVHPYHHQHQVHHQQEEVVMVDNDLAQRQRVGELLRRFDYRQPSPSLDTSLVKALARILWDMVSWPPTTKEEEDKTTTTVVPPVCAAVGLSVDEYRYLVRSSLRNFRPADETMCVQKSNQHAMCGNLSCIESTLRRGMKRLDPLV
jgi:hypothetical protein